MLSRLQIFDIMSSNIIAVLDQDLTTILLTPTEPILVRSNCSTPEAAASSLRKAAPPAEVKIALVMFAAQTFEFRQRTVKALRHEGYTNIESIDFRSIALSSTISDMPLKCEIGEPVFVNYTTEYIASFDNYGFSVIKKCEKGWQLFDINQNPVNALSKYPSTRNIVIYKNAPKAIKEEVKKLFPGLKLHFCKGFRQNDNIAYMRSRVNKTLLSGNEVLPFCSVKLTVSFSNTIESIMLTSRVPPFTIKRKIDVGDAPQVTIYGSSVGPNPSIFEMKKLSFKDKAFRNVLITVDVDKTLIPVVTMKVVSTYKPRNYETPVIYSAWMQNDKYFLFANCEDRVSNDGVYTTVADIITHIKKSSSVTATKAVYCLYACGNTIRQLQEFRDTFAAAEEYPPVKLLCSDSMTLSLSFDRAEISVMPGQTVVLMSPNVVYVVQRYGELLKGVDMIVDTWFKVIPYTETADVIVGNAKTLNVIQYRGVDYSESVQKFNTPKDAKAVRFTISVKSACDITVTMDVIDETEVTQQPKKAIDNPKQQTSTVNFLIQFGTKCKTVALGEQKPPCKVKKEFDIGDAAEVMVRAYFRDKVHSTATVETLKFKKSAFRKVLITVNINQDYAMELKLQTASTYKPIVQPTVTVSAKQSVDKTVDVTLPLSPSNDAASGTKSRSQLRRQARRNAAKNAIAEKPPNESTAAAETQDNQVNTNREITTLTFTSDNRVLIEAGETYTGDKELLAYVHLESGKAPEVGQKAFDALKEYPGFVFYDVTRLMAADFDPDHPDPSWHFKTTRDFDGKVLVHGDDELVTLPIVLFGFIVKCIQNNIKEHQKSDVPILGILLPAGSDDDKVHVLGDDGVVTLPIVLFGMIVKCTLIYIKEHMKSDVPLLGIRLPAGSVISEDDLKTISPLIGVELVQL
uniref:IgGFc_binding domain-containing protein n=1 Tax=Panagrellus redivivus TaxID=6233 RepID=A0A7E4UMN2_PANRE